MAKNSVLDWDSTAANNSDVGGINILGTAPVSNMDDALRTIMAQVAAGILGGLFSGVPTATKSADYTVLTTDRGTLFDCTSNLTLSLPAAATAAASFSFIAKANGASVIIDPSSTELIDGASTVTLTTGQAALVVCTGTAWKTAYIAATPASATTSASGIVELATDAETQTGTDTARAITPSNLTAKEATVSNYRANTADRILTTDIVWSSAAYVSLTDAATIAIDFSTFINATVTLGGNRTLGAPSNPKNGQTGCIEIVQDGTGSRTLAFHADWLFAGGSDPVVSTTAGAKDLLFYEVLSTGKTFGNLIKAVA
jgi:hypothetical protein